MSMQPVTQQILSTIDVAAVGATASPSIAIALALRAAPGDTDDVASTASAGTHSPYPLLDFLNDHYPA